jgi:hypothetical protein
MAQSSRSHESAPFEPHLLLPVGTHVFAQRAIYGADGTQLCGRSAVGIVVEVIHNQHTQYRVRLVNGVEIVVDRHDIGVRKLHRAQTLQMSPVVDGLKQHVILRCVVGSRAYGLDHAASDTDRRGIYLAPPDVQWSLAGAPEQLEYPDTQECYWELQKFLMMALRANPNILECLYTPLVEQVTPLAQALLDMRHIFLSKFIYQTYNGYVLSQFKKLEQDLRTHGEPNWKHAMHLIRLLLSGITVLREGFVVVRVDAYRERLLAIRRKEMAWEQVNEWRLRLHHEFDEAFLTTTLPERPDFERANDFLLLARRSMVT